MIIYLVKEQSIETCILGVSNDDGTMMSILDLLKSGIGSPLKGLIEMKMYDIPRLVFTGEGTDGIVPFSLFGAKFNLISTYRQKKNNPQQLREILQNLVKMINAGGTNLTEIELSDLLRDYEHYLDIVSSKKNFPFDIIFGEEYVAPVRDYFSYLLLSPGLQTKDIGQVVNLESDSIFINLPPLSYIRAFYGHDFLEDINITNTVLKAVMPTHLLHPYLKSPDLLVYNKYVNELNKLGLPLVWLTGIKENNLLEIQSNEEKLFEKLKNLVDESLKTLAEGVPYDSSLIDFFEEMIDNILVVSRGFTGNVIMKDLTGLGEYDPGSDDEWDEASDVSPLIFMRDVGSGAQGEAVASMVSKDGGQNLKSFLHKALVFNKYAHPEAIIKLLRWGNRKPLELYISGLETERLNLIDFNSVKDYGTYVSMDPIVEDGYNRFLPRLIVDNSYILGIELERRYESDLKIKEYMDIVTLYRELMEGRISVEGIEYNSEAKTFSCDISSTPHISLEEFKMIMAKGKKIESNLLRHSYNFEELWGVFFSVKERSYPELADKTSVVDKLTLLLSTLDDEQEQSYYNEMIYAFQSKNSALFAKTMNRLTGLQIKESDGTGIHSFYIEVDDAKTFMAHLTADQSIKEVFKNITTFSLTGATPVEGIKLLIERESFPPVIKDKKDLKIAVKNGELKNDREGFLIAGLVPYYKGIKCLSAGDNLESSLIKLDYELSKSEETDIFKSKSTKEEIILLLDKQLSSVVPLEQIGGKLIKGCLTVNNKEHVSLLTILYENKAIELIPKMAVSPQLIVNINKMREETVMQLLKNIGDLIVNKSAKRFIQFRTDAALLNCVAELLTLDYDTYIKFLNPTGLDTFEEVLLERFRSGRL